MIDDGLEVGSGFDWISPVMELFHRARGADVGMDALPSENFSWCNQTLKNAGIEMRHVMFVGDSFTFSVSKKDADRTRAILGIE